MQRSSSRDTVARLARTLGFLACTVLLLALTADPATGDTIHLTNGDVITGKILDLDDNEIVFDADLIDEVRIAIENIAFIESSRPFVVSYDDGRELTVYLVEENGKMTVRPMQPDTAVASEAATDAEAAAAATAAPELDVPRVVDLANLHMLEPVQPFYRYKGEIDVGLNAASGNTDTSHFNASGMLAPSFGKNTVRLSGQLNRTISDGDTTESNWRAQAGYERELTRRWRAIALNRYESDRFQDLDLRVTATAGPGYTILLGDPSLDVFLAPAFVHETFSSDSDRGFAALSWSLNFEYDVPSPHVTLYHNHNLTMGVTESQTIALTTTGLKWKLIGDLDLKLEYQLDWNNQPADTAEELDHRYIIKLSYGFEGNETNWWQ